MDNEIASGLDEIILILYVMLALIAAGVLANWIRVIMLLRNKFKKEIEDNFIDTACRLYERENYQELINHCENYLQDRPNNVHGFWYMAKAQYQLKNYDKAKELLEKVSDLEPSWVQSHIEPFIRKIKSMAG